MWVFVVTGRRNDLMGTRQLQDTGEIRLFLNCFSFVNLKIMPM